MVRSGLIRNNLARPSRLHQEYLNDDCHRIYSCVHCRAHLANHDELISTAFQGTHGRAYLFNSVINVGCGPAEQRLLMTGLHDVADIYCDSCKTTLGWKYKQAFEASQKYKEGKYIIELAHMLKENSWDLTSYNAKDILKNQQILINDRRRRPNYNPWPAQQDSSDQILETSTSIVTTNKTLSDISTNSNNCNSSNSPSTTSSFILSKIKNIDFKNKKDGNQDRIVSKTDKAEKQLADTTMLNDNSDASTSPSVGDLLKINHNLHQGVKMAVFRGPALYGENKDINHKQQIIMFELGDNDISSVGTTNNATTAIDIKQPKIANIICDNTGYVDEKKNLPELHLTPSTSCSSSTSSSSPSTLSSSVSSTSLSASSSSSLIQSPSFIPTVSTPFQRNLSQFGHQVKNYSEQAT